MYDSRIQSALLGFVIALAITLSMLLRRNKDHKQMLFIVLSGNVALYYLFTFFFQWQGNPWFERLSLLCAIALPLGGLQFFRSFNTTGQTRVRLHRTALVFAVLLAIITLHPSGVRPALGPAILIYFVGFMLVAILDFIVLARTALTRVDAARIRYLAVGGLIVITLQITDRLDLIWDVNLPPIGLAASLVYLYIISQAIVRYRILDLYEMLGRLALMTAMGALLAIIYTVLVFWAGRDITLNVFLASLVILLMFDPLRDFVEQKIADLIFGERRILEEKVNAIKQRIAHVFTIEQMAEELLQGLEDSRRFTHVSLYMLDAQGSGFDRHPLSFGPEPATQRVEMMAARRFFRPFAKNGAVITAELELRRERSLSIGKEEAPDLIAEVLETLEDLSADVLLLLEGEDDLLGLLSLKDERIKDPLSPEEVSLLAGLTHQAAITAGNSQLYQKMKERDRLAALGEMSAGLAHEIRNPLGAIKAAAQYIEEVVQEEHNENAEYLQIIIEEANRLNRVVNDFLVYARPSSGAPAVLEVNALLQRTAQIFETGNRDALELRIDTSAELPHVLIDGERLHQVFLNLMMNAAQAMKDQTHRRLDITTRTRKIRRFTRGSPNAQYSSLVEVLFADNGPGIPPGLLQKVFIPFYTTRSTGYGLGLAICQRLIRDAQGEIEVRSQVGQGTIFTVVLPAVIPEETEDATP
ncbi:MAG: ATP-binding protein [Proteobacteria bacterium]|nr:ATP-binding protein [Pseudomonadota bacterium]